MQGILYLDRAPKLAEDTPTAMANTKANIKHISIRGSEKGTVKNLRIPFLYIKYSVRNKNTEDSAQDNNMMGELISHIKGR